MNLGNYDIIVVGAGHAGCEAAASAANMGSKVLLVTMNLETIAKMSCNPAMGGVAKGQIVREIDAIGGLSGIITDKTMIQFRMLNSSKGPAMWSPRAQSDRFRFSEEWRLALENIPNISFFQDSVSELIFDKNKACGVKTSIGAVAHSKAVVLTNGTFLSGLIHIGTKQFGGGRMAESASFGITKQLNDLGFESGRMKTGTPPRVDGRTIDYSKTQEQKGDENPGKFSYLPLTQPLKEQRSCYITYTNENVHNILREGFDESPMFNGSIKGLGPRYCPSIEDKINRFAERDRHQLFIEPEGWKTIEVYVNGFSTSLPDHVQIKALQQVPGFEHAKMFRPGYAIEYDYFPPTQLRLTLETKNIDNLYFAGQINGTTGYEEAACQGLMAGINAHLKINHKNPFILKRSDAYIGVLLDDLVNKGTDEPYRMFTSRAEYRIMLRQDNADIRLTELSHNIGLASDERLKLVNKKVETSNEIISYFKTTSITPTEANNMLSKNDSSAIVENYKASQLLLRPEIEINNFNEIDKTYSFLKNKEQEHILQAEIQIKYESYLQKELEMVEKINRLEDYILSDAFDYSSIRSLSLEAREKLNTVKPSSIGQAARISGVNPADISVLLIHFGR